MSAEQPPVHEERLTREQWAKEKADAIRVLGRIGAECAVESITEGVRYKIYPGRLTNLSCRLCKVDPSVSKPVRDKKYTRAELEEHLKNIYHPSVTRHMDHSLADFPSTFELSCFICAEEPPFVAVAEWREHLLTHTPLASVVACRTSHYLVELAVEEETEIKEEGL